MRHSVHHEWITHIRIRGNIEKKVNIFHNYDNWNFEYSDCNFLCVGSKNERSFDSWSLWRSDTLHGDCVDGPYWPTVTKSYMQRNSSYRKYARFVAVRDIWVKNNSRSVIKFELIFSNVLSVVRKIQSNEELTEVMKKKVCGICRIYKCIYLHIIFSRTSFNNLLRK